MDSSRDQPNPLDPLDLLDPLDFLDPLDPLDPLNMYIYFGNQTSTNIFRPFTLERQSPERFATRPLVARPQGFLSRSSVAHDESPGASYQNEPIFSPDNYLSSILIDRDNGIRRSQTTLDEILGILDTYMSILPPLEDYPKDTKTVSHGMFSSFPTKNNDSTCSICLETNLEGEVIELPCKHYFHKDCVSKWLLDFSNTCPMCKREY